MSAIVDWISAHKMITMIVGGIATFGTVTLLSSSAPVSEQAPTAAAPGQKPSKTAAVPGGNNPGSQMPQSAVSSGDDTPEERIGIVEMNLAAIRQDVIATQQGTAEMYAAIARQLEDMQGQLQSGQQAAARAPQVELPPLMRQARLNERFQSEYQAKVSHFKSNRGSGWAMSEAEYAGLTQSLLRPDTFSVFTGGGGGLQPSPRISQTIDGDRPVIVNMNSYVLPAGSRIVAITENVVSSDHSGYFTSRIVRPDILRGAKLICQQGGQTNNRIPVQVVKVVLDGEDYPLSGQIEMGFPGITGKINRHYGSRALPITANAAITGGFVAWSARNRGSDRIDTRDAITGEVVAQTLPQVQNEIAKFAVDRPNTVTVPSGTQFSILLIDALTVSRR